MAINKVIYGTTVLVDLTSDTVDAAHLAKGYTAHDAAGNLVSGTLEQQSGGNLLSGITPSLLNGTTQSGNSYVIPDSKNNGVDYIEYTLDHHAPTSDTTYRLSAFGESKDAYGTIVSVFLYVHGTGGSTSIRKNYFLLDGSVPQATDIELSSGERIVRIVFGSYANQKSSSISKIALNALEG